MKSGKLEILAFLLLSFLILAFWGCADKKNIISNPPPPSGTVGLSLGLDTTLDRAGILKVESITSAILVDTLGLTAKTSIILDGRAEFNLEGVIPGDYFVILNGLNRDRIPTRVLDSAQVIQQSVGKTLRSSLIINGNDTLYHIQTYFGAMGENPVRKYSNGENVIPEEYAYTILSLRPDSEVLEIKLDSTAALLQDMPDPHGPSHHFSTWIMGDSSHGIGPASEPDSIAWLCGTTGCHSNLNARPMMWSMITPARGYCNKCHYGSGGPMQGFIDPNQ